MRGIHILRLLERDKLTMNFFGGIISKDMLTFPLPNREIFYICNTDIFENEGLHWVVIYLPYNSDVIEYFDSLGKRPGKLFTDFMQKGNKTIIYSIKKIQKSNSDACGFYCLYFLYLRCRKISFERIIEEFFKSNSGNETNITKFVKESYV